MVVVEPVVARIVSGPCRTPGGAPLGAIGQREQSRCRDGNRLAPPLLRTGVRFPGASEVHGFGLTSPLPDRPNGRRGGVDSIRKSYKPKLFW